MTDGPDFFSELGTATCAVCGGLMVAEGDVREVDRGDGQLVTQGSAWWRCPRDGFVRLA